MAYLSDSLTIADAKAFIQKHSVDKGQEEKWMIRYTKIYTRELVFAVDLTSFVMKEKHLQFQNFIFPNCLGRRCESDFDYVMETFVVLHLLKHGTVIRDLLEKNVDMIRPSYAAFKSYVNSLAVATESAVHFKEYTFLIFSVVIAHISSLAFLYGMSKAPDFGIMIMCRLHSQFGLKGLLSQNTWVELKDSARKGILMYTEQNSLNAVNTIS